MKTKEEILNSITIGANNNRITDYISRHGYVWDIILLAMQEYSDLTNAKLIQENEDLKSMRQTAIDFGKVLNDKNDLLESELSKANSRIAELEEALHNYLNVLNWRKENDIENWDNSDGDQFNYLMGLLNQSSHNPDTTNQGD